MISTGLLQRLQHNHQKVVHQDEGSTGLTRLVVSCRPKECQRDKGRQDQELEGSGTHHYVCRGHPPKDSQWRSLS